jgi:tetratricopeptide (TPR) repeat protein
MFCPNCGRQIPDGSKFCPYCGAKIAYGGTSSKKEVSESEVSSEGGSRNRKRNFLPILLIVFVLVVIVSGIFFYLKFFPKVNQEASIEHNSKGLSILESINPTDTQSLTKNIPLAKSEFEKAVNLNPNNASARKNLAYTYLFNGDLKDATKELYEVLKVNPQDEFAKKMYKLLTEEGE